MFHNCIAISCTETFDPKIDLEEAEVEVLEVEVVVEEGLEVEEVEEVLEESCWREGCCERAVWDALGVEGAGVLVERLGAIAAG